MPSFYFEQLLQTALAGIDVNVTNPVIQVAGVILIFSMLFGIYEAHSNGGDVRHLAVVGAKYLVLGLLFANYQQAFRAVNGMFNQVADYMYGLNGVGDVIKTWINNLSQQWNNNWFSALWNIVAGGGASAVLATLLTLSGYILLPITYTLFTLAYTIYGSVLYVVGPFVLALMPSRSMGRLAHGYFINMMIFQSWGLLYAILQVLMTALQMGSVNQALGTSSIFNAFVGTNPITLLSLACLLFSISIAIIPLIASRIVHGEIGSTMGDVIRAVGVAASSAAAATIGMSAAQMPPVEVAEPLSGFGGPGNPGFLQLLPSARPPQPPPEGSGGSPQASARPPRALEQPATGSPQTAQSQPSNTEAGGP